ncbi:energy transducer TonB, partial [Teichococcus cervicalis]
RAAVAPPASYQNRLFSALERAKRYPNSARLRRIQGQALLQFTVRADGSVAHWRLLRSSGQDILDEAVVEMIQSARLPAFPPEMGSDPVTMTVPVTFTLR